MKTVLITIFFLNAKRSKTTRKIKSEKWAHVKQIGSQNQINEQNNWNGPVGHTTHRWSAELNLRM